MNDRDEVKVVNDQRGSSTWAFDLAMVIKILLKQQKKAKTYLLAYTIIQMKAI
jgi:dTDP-4-dehydrorhamnose reductase